MNEPPAVRRGAHRLGGREPDAGLDEPRPPRPARRRHPRHAERARGDDRRAADRPRRAQGRAQHLPARRRTPTFAEHEFELAKWFGDAAALALDNAQIRARLEHLAQTDSLTGLYNHRYFHERLRSELTRASRSHDSVAVLMFDLDDFKRVNDVYGHGAGDQLLVQRRARRARDRARLRRRLPHRRRGVRRDHAVVRRRRRARSRLAADRARCASSTFDPAGRMTVSIGVAQGPQHAMNPRELVACAEAAMMTAKARGKNQTVALRRRRDRAARAPTAVARPRRALDRAPEDAAVARRQAQPAERRRADRQHDRDRAAAADRLPQLPRRPARRRRPAADRVRRRLRHERRHAARRVHA